MKQLVTRIISGLLLAISLLAFNGCKSETATSESTGQRWDDKTVTHNVKKGLKDNSMTKSAKLEVQSYKGCVSLSGFVDDPAQKQAASTVAQRTPGVEWYQNNILVRAHTPSAGVASASGSTIQEAAGAETGKWQRGQFNTGSQSPQH